MATSVDLGRRTGGRREQDHGDLGPVRRPTCGLPRLLAPGAVVVTTTVLVVAALVGGAASPSAVADPGALTRWGLLGLRASYDLTAMATIGVLVAALLVLPSSGGLSPQSVRLVRVAGRWSAAWAGVSALSVPFVLSDVSGFPLWQVVAPDVLPLATELAQTRGLLSSAWLAALVLIGSRWCTTVAMGRLLLVTAVGSLLPLLLTGHARHGDHQVLAAVGLSAHVTAASLWLGGLLALAVHLRHADLLTVALPRYSRMALGCFVVVGLSGGLLGRITLADPQQLVTTSYGQLLVGKVVALVVLGGIGALHRRRTIPAVLARRPRAFMAMATVELLVMVGTAGLAVGLSRTPPPDGGEHAGAATVPAVVVGARTSSDGVDGV